MQASSYRLGDDVETDCPKVNEAWELAVKTVRYNIRDSILAAGADYGGEWTRDVAINTWNGTDLFIPEVMERSLWHVTDGRRTVDINIGIRSFGCREPIITICLPAIRIS